VIDAILARYAGRRADARQFALRYRVVLRATPVGVPVDIALAAIPFEADMIARATDIEMEPHVSLRICSAEDLLVLKPLRIGPEIARTWWGSPAGGAARSTGTRC
jgi:hypothetical protein